MVLALQTAAENDASAFLVASFRLSVDDVREVFKAEMRQLYREVWELSWDHCETCGSCAVPLEYRVAVRSYSLDRPNVCRQFNRKCRDAISFEGWTRFTYKALWWLLMEALVHLPAPLSGSPTLYRGLNNVTCLPRRGTAIIFGQFLSASLSPDEARKFAKYNGTLLELRSVPKEAYRLVAPYVKYPHHREVLLFPFCVFCVIDVNAGGLCLEYRRCLTTKSDVLSHIRRRLSNGRMANYFSPRAGTTLGTRLGVTVNDRQQEVARYRVPPTVVAPPIRLTAEHQAGIYSDCRRRPPEPLCIIL